MYRPDELQELEELWHSQLMLERWSEQLQVPRDTPVESYDILVGFMPNGCITNTDFLPPN